MRQLCARVYSMGGDRDIFHIAFPLPLSSHPQIMNRLGSLEAKLMFGGDPAMIIPGSTAGLQYLQCSLAGRLHERPFGVAINVDGWIALMEDLGMLPPSLGGK